ncbi:MAG: cupin domain-containing protein [Syntrophomonadaceae bacterium]|nr:cupin domain-containing protein [Syntrophomonadaceae bacterium]MDD4550110.1 cupin domain-containing protein [Syntrophomonadaceae bacterium]
MCSKCFPRFCKYCSHFHDHGPCPFVTNIEKETLKNNNYRTALWTGKYLQLTLMSIEDEIGVEMHPDLDQFIRLEQGEGIIMMGESRDSLNFQRKVYDDDVILIPAGTWHNLINTGRVPIKLYSIYAPPEHPWGTVHKTREDSEESH